MRVFSIAGLFAAAALAAAPTVQIQNGTVVGASSNGIDSFKGIPFAQQPVGNLRLRRPQSISQSFGTFMATSPSRSCPQFLFSNNQSGFQNVPLDVLGQLLDNPLLQAATNTGEDCLNINIYRPSNVTTSSKLPVLFWIYGGAFSFGSNGMYDGSPLVEKSIALGHPIIFVAVNYRVAGFGFLPGKEPQNEGNTNLGLRDQRLGLQWVQENIAAFGGDPDKVTIFGESAGSSSVYYQMIINGGDITYRGKPLFRGAIMDSGSFFPATEVNSKLPEQVYSSVIKSAGCANASDTQACLRSLPYEKFLSAVNSVPGLFTGNIFGFAYLPRPDPKDNFFPVSPEVPAYKSKLPVPFIIGDQEDEGTIFTFNKYNVTNTAEFIQYLQESFPTAPRSLLVQIANLYPDDPSAGSPFGTGPLFNYYSQYKRITAFTGDKLFTLARRTLLTLQADKQTAYSYLSTYFSPGPLGTFHASDLLGLFFRAGLPVPSSAQMTYYISFVNFLDPNTISTAAPIIPWPRWSKQNPTLINFGATTITTLPDTFRKAAGDFLTKYTPMLRV